MFFVRVCFIAHHRFQIKTASINLNGNILQVSKYKHLGVIIGRSGNEEQIVRRIEASNELYYTLRDSVTGKR